MDRAHVKRDFTVEQICQLVQALGSVDYRRESPEGAYQFQTICHNPPGCGSYKLYYYLYSYGNSCIFDILCN